MNLNLLSENEVLITQNAKGLKFEENAKMLKTQINESEIDIFPVLLHQNGSRQICNNEILVKLKNNASLKQLLSKYRYTLIPKNFNKNLYLVKLENINTFQVFDLLNQLQDNPNVAYAEPDFIFFINLHTDDTYYASQWSINNQGYLGGTPDADMDVDEAWKLLKYKGKYIDNPDKSVRIAVIDGGIELNHPDLAANLLPGYDATGGNSAGANDFNIEHGTACAGVIAAVANNGKGIAGVAYDAKIIPVKIFEGYSTSNFSNIVDAINWAVQNGANILSNSWGISGEIPSITDAINDAVNAGCIVLASTGNSDLSSIEFPASLDNVISVGASTMCNDERKSKNPVSCDGENWWGSNYGEGLDVIAPGVKIYTTDLKGIQGKNPNGDYRSNFWGTSAACPNVAGVVALMLSVKPDLNIDDVRQILAETADKPSGYTYSAKSHKYGEWNQEVGYGRVNANKAILSVLGVKVSGQDRVCSPNAVYTLENIPKDATVSPVWTKSDNLYEVGGQGTLEYTVRGILGSGTGWVQADIGGAIFRKEITWIGKPDVELERESNGNYVTTYLVGANGTNVKEQGITSVVWEILSTNKGECPASFFGKGFIGQGSGNCFNWLVELKITVSNDCGTTIIYENVSPQAVDPCDEDGRITFSQNPMKEGASTNKIIIDPCRSSNEKGADSAQYTISIHTHHGEQVYTKTQKATEFNISHLKKGFYIVRFTTENGQSFSKHLIIE